MIKIGTKNALVWSFTEINRTHTMHCEQPKMEAGSLIFNRQCLASIVICYLAGVRVGSGFRIS
jgi:hypothetical protein